MLTKLGKTFLTSLVKMREERGNLTIEDFGRIFVDISASLNPQGSVADQFMHDEIHKLVQYISDAKKEIFAINSTDKSNAAIMDASQHLDEVIKETEAASNTIMDAADKIQAGATGIGGDKEKAIMDATNTIYEACNFQDITGQRIRKVIKLLESIEERIGKLNGLFGSDGIQAAESAQNGSPSDSDLLHGPQLASEASSQADVDALLASFGKN